MLEIKLNSIDQSRLERLAIKAGLSTEYLVIDVIVDYLNRAEAIEDKAFQEKTDKVIEVVKEFIKGGKHGDR